MKDVIGSVDTANQLDKISQLKLYEFRMKVFLRFLFVLTSAKNGIATEHSEVQRGVLAQEVREIFPNVVVESGIGVTLEYLIFNLFFNKNQLRRERGQFVDG